MAGGETTLKRIVLTGAMIAALTAIAATAGAVVIPELASPVAVSSYQPPPPPIVSKSPTPAPASPAPDASPTPAPAVGARPASAFAEWAGTLSGPLGIPQNVLEAYGYAEWVLTQTRATCKLQWTTLAALGKIASDHGRVDGRTVDAQGRPQPVLMGPALDGTSGRSKVDDSDGGALDGDQKWDRAMGPMQLTPAMWRASGVDADSNELAQPQDIDDAALAAGYQLCGAASGEGARDLSKVAHWKAAINGYPGMAKNIDKVFDAAQSYGLISRATLP